MSTSLPTSSTAAKPSKAASSPKTPPKARLQAQMDNAGREAQRLAAAILEVLAGVRTPTDAAAALGISVPRYYLWEQRALTGFVTACAPRSVGKTPSAQRRIAGLEREVVRLRQDCVRQQALVRAAQRTIGLAPPVTPAKAATKAGGRPGGKGSRKRRPVVRALKAVTTLRSAAASAASPPGTSAPLVTDGGQSAASIPPPPTRLSLPSVTAGVEFSG
jgi:hypothetical protein